MAGKMALSSYEHPIMSKVTRTSKRKSEHIRINLEEDVRSGLTTGLERFQFEHLAVPELDFSKIDLSLNFLELALQAPLLISSMTGGTQEAKAINIALAEAAEAKGIALGLGSQRAALENRDLEDTYNIRKYAPTIPIFANLGAVQINYGYALDECKRAVEMVQADALVLHFNALQEALQPEGDTNFEGLLSKIENIATHLSVPIIAKEVGWGIGAHSARLLIDSGVRVIDIAGAGGTSWSQVEMYRADTEARAKIAATFIDWGIPTSSAVIEVHQALPQIDIIASGGLRSGVDIAKCIALGASLGGMASPYLKAAVISTRAVVEAIDLVIAELKICMFASGIADLQALRSYELRQAR